MNGIEHYKCATSCTVYVEEELFGKTYKHCYDSCPESHKWMTGDVCGTECATEQFVLQVNEGVEAFVCLDENEIADYGFFVNVVIGNDITYKRRLTTCEEVDLIYDVDGECVAECIDSKPYISDNHCIEKCEEIFNEMNICITCK